MDLGPPSELYREVLMAVELKEEREVYLAPPHIAQELPGEIQRRMSTRSKMRRASRFCGRSRWQHLASGSTRGRRPRMKPRPKRCRSDTLVANRSLGAYETIVTESQPIGFEPRWPEVSFQELVRLAFRGGKLIDKF